jgi:hypothetical protein
MYKSLLLAIILVASTGMSRWTIFSQPWWLVLSILTLVYLGVNQKLKRIFSSKNRKLIGLSILWIVYSVYIGIRNEEWYVILGQTSNTPIRSIFNIASLILFIATVCLGILIPPRTTVFIIAVISSVYSTIAIEQVLGNDWANSLPEYLVTNQQEVDQVEVDANRSSNIRARGLDQYVHKYSLYQGVFAVILMAESVFIVRQKSVSLTYRVTIIAAGVLSILGVVNSFSRAPLYSWLITFFVACFVSRSIPVMIAFFGFILGAAALIIYGGVDHVISDGMLSRLFVVDFENSNDDARFNSWVNSFNLFLANPIFGSGSHANSRFELIAHNVPIRILGDYGLTGLFFYLSIWFFILKISYTTFVNASRSSKYVGFVALSACFASIFDASFHSSGLLQRDVSQSAILGTCVGMSMNIVLTKMVVNRSASK